MRAVLAIAGNTFREAIRDRVLYLFLGFALLLLVGTKIFGMLTVGDEGKVIKDIGLAGVQLFSMLIAVMMSVTLISREVDNRTIFNILAKPVERWQFLVGKYLGLLATLAANLGLMVFVLVVVVVVYQHELDLLLVFGGVMVLLEMTVVAAFATLFAVLTKPILGSVMTLAVWVIGHLSADLWQLTRHVEDQVARGLVAVVYYLLPNLERFNFKTEIVHALPIPLAAVAWAVLYAALFAALVMTLACFQLGRRDLM
jgi:ABC-type transport system involved in multi-copper enzyme maturation permease subunit